MRMRKPSEKFPAIRRSRQSSNRSQAPGHSRRDKRRHAMTTKIVTRILCSVLLTQLVLLADFVHSQSDFYRGKTITIIHGRSAGGSGDYRARAVAPFLQKYIPGNPTIVHEHMDGGG